MPVDENAEFLVKLCGGPVEVAKFLEGIVWNHGIAGQSNKQQLGGARHATTPRPVDLGDRTKNAATGYSVLVACGNDFAYKVGEILEVNISLQFDTVGRSRRSGETHLKRKRDLNLSPHFLIFAT